MQSETSLKLTGTSTLLQYDGGDEEWDKFLSETGVSTHVQASAWARAFSAHGWITCRWTIEDKDKQTIYLQGFLKRMPFGCGIMWFPDWLSGDYSYSEGLAEALRKLLGTRHLYLRFRSLHEYSDQQYVQLCLQGWHRPTNLFNEGLTMVLDLSKSAQEMESRMTSNWRRNLKRSSRFNYSVSRIHDPAVVIRLYEELRRMKELDEIMSETEIRGLMQAYGEGLVVLGAVTPDGKVLAVRGAICYQQYGWDIFAATGPDARKNYISYALFVALINECKNRGCVHYNLNGIDPVNNVGVFNFKRGSGATIKRQLGEFEWSSSRLLAKLVNFRVQSR
jgi:hypothetical protein